GQLYCGGCLGRQSARGHPHRWLTAASGQSLHTAGDKSRFHPGARTPTVHPLTYFEGPVMNTSYRSFLLRSISVMALAAGLSMANAEGPAAGAPVLKGKAVTESNLIDALTPEET